MMEGLKRLKSLTRIELEGVKVLARFDFNVPINGGEIADDFRLRKALPTLEFLKHSGARVIIMSHLEDVYSKDGGASSLYPVWEYLKSHFEIDFCPDLEKAKVMSKDLKNGEFLLLENLRFHEGEKQNDESFARELATLGDIYLNECFSVSHRNHASVVGVPKLLNGVVGPLFESEIENLSKALSPEHPFVFVLGGAKFETKLPLIKKYLNIADHVVVAGALANDFFKAKGYEIGNSSVYGKHDISDIVNDPKIVLPLDVGVWTNKGVEYRESDKIQAGDKIRDIGPDSLLAWRLLMEKAKFILWNGPLGNYEMGFKEKTIEFARIVSESSAYSVVGGGDTTAVLAKAGIVDQFGFVSTGGGAMLEFLEKGTLPGIEALRR